MVNGTLENITILIPFSRVNTGKLYKNKSPKCCFSDLDNECKMKFFYDFIKANIYKTDY